MPLRKWPLRLIMLLGALPSHALHAKDDLDVQLSSPASLTARDSGRLIVSITNRSSRALLLPRLRTPLFNPDDHLMSNFINVLDANGKQARFIGRFVTISFEAKDSFYVAIRPGQTFQKEIDLSQDYDLSAGGMFHVSYTQDYGETDLYESDDYAAHKSASNELTIFVSANLLRKNKKSRIETSGYVQPKCKADQLASIAAARSRAAEWNHQAWGALVENIEIEERNEEDNRGDLATLARWRMKATPDYTFWFGEPGNDEKFVEELSPDFDFNKTDFRPLGVVEAVGNALSATSSRCGCDPAKYSRDALAWANQSEATIHYCEAFFNAPRDRSSGQAITILHEISHLLSDPNLVTSDYAYGRKQAHALSIVNRAQAVRNADNYNFYIEAINHIY